MRVGIFETTHFEGAYPVIKCFDNGANEITIFCYEESYRQFQHLFEGQMEKFSWVVKSQQDSKYKFIYRIYKETKSRKLDLLYLNTKFFDRNKIVGPLANGVIDIAFQFIFFGFCFFGK